MSVFLCNQKLTEDLSTAVPTINTRCDEGMSTYDGKAINIVNSDVEGTFPVIATTACACVTACQNEPGCAYSQFSDILGCNLAFVGGACSAKAVIGQFYTVSGGGSAINIANGPCGELTYGGDNAK